MIETIETKIETNPEVCGGQPTIAGRRIRVSDVAIWHIEMGRPPAEIAEDYHLEVAEVHAALSYYFDHKEKIDQEIRDAQAVIEKAWAKTRSKLSS